MGENGWDGESKTMGCNELMLQRSEGVKEGESAGKGEKRWKSDKHQMKEKDLQCDIRCQPLARGQSLMKTIITTVSGPLPLRLSMTVNLGVPATACENI